MKVLVLFAAVLTLSAANPLAPSFANPLAHFVAANSLTNRQADPPSCGGTTLSSECTQALIDSQRAASMFYTDPSPDPFELASSFQPLYVKVCSSQCLGTLLKIYACLNLLDAFALQCTRHADGTYCPVKLLEEAAVMNGTVSLVPPCVQTNMCDAACQTTYRTTSAGLGCCGGTWFASPSSPLTNTLGRNFATCNVTLEDACSTPTAGAASIYLSTLLVVALILLSIGMLI